ncbi:hypothetical protein PTKIN_Ptkin03bG0137800 [Pterospermum kingtungense]
MERIKSVRVKNRKRKKLLDVPKGKMDLQFGRKAIMYVVDSSDTDRLVIAKEEFHAILEEEELRGAVVLIFANKQDLPGALDDAAVTEALELHKIKNRQWAIFKTSAIKGEGLFEGLDCLLSESDIRLQIIYIILWAAKSFIFLVSCSLFEGGATN